jgi:hypothetical protein
MVTVPVPVFFTSAFYFEQLRRMHDIKEILKVLMIFLIRMKKGKPHTYNKFILLLPL